MKIQSHLPVQPKTEDLDKKMKEGAQLYERHFLNEMVKAMRQTVQATNQPSMAKRIYEDKMFDNYTESWSKSGGIGLAEMIYNQLKDKFGNSSMPMQKPQGPVPLEDGTHIKIDNTQQMGIPIIKSQQDSNLDMSFLMEWKDSGPGKTVSSPWEGEVLQAFRTQDHRQTIKLSHDNGLVSTMSFIGTSKDLQPGDFIESGAAIGRVSPETSALSWQIVQSKPNA